MSLGRLMLNVPILLWLAPGQMSPVVLEKMGVEEEPQPPTAEATFSINCP